MKRVSFDEREELISALKVWKKDFVPDFDDYDTDLIIRKSLFVKEKLLPLLKECYPSIKNATYFVCDNNQELYEGLIHLLSGDEYVVIQYDDFQRYINVTADSFSAMTTDILKHLG